jgi:beta-galactosidase
MNTFARLFLVLLAVSSSAAETVQRLSGGWEYYQGTLGSTWEVWRGDAASDNVTWSPVALPHCFNGRDSVDPDVRYYQGQGWYRTKLKIANPYPKGRTLLKFDGAGQKSEVFVYTTKVGSHVGGYDEWAVDITDAAAKAAARPESKGEVPVAVLCDNSRDAESIPSDLSDFNRYGGLYRHVSLVYVPAIAVARVGVAATVKGTKGEVAFDIRLSNPSALADDVTCEVVVTDPTCKVAARSEQAAVSASLGGITARIALENPALWSPRSPQLYRATVTLRSKHGEQVVAEAFGFRSVEWVEHGPFKLNGERLLLKGTHYHEDHAGVAAAVPDEVVRQTLVAIKDMGANFVRLGHYQQAPLVLKLCDELGLLVWEEIPWCRGGIGGDRYKQQCRDMLKALIEQHGNHPSVIMWGLGNENDWPGDFETQDKEGIRAFMKELNDLSHQLDPSRPTTIRRCDFCKDIVDVYSPSIWAGWYSGRYTEYAASAEKALKDTKHFFHAEWGGDSHARRFSEEPEKIIAKVAVGEGTAEKGKAYKKSGGKVRMSKDGDWSESYMINLFDWHLKEQEKMPWLTGSAQWIFKDFATPLRPENPVPRVNQKGVVERDGTPKESYFVFQSYWAEKPMVRLLGHEWPVRWGKPGEAKEIRVYSNCAEVELFADGKSLGVKKRDSQDFPAAGLRWNVVLKDGPNQLRAVAQSASGNLVDELTVGYQSKSWGKPAKLTLIELSQKDGVVTIEARMADAEGVPCLDCSNIVRFGMVGEGQLLDNLGTSTGSRVVQMYNGRAQISAKVTGHKAVFSASSEGRRTQFLNVENKAVAVAAPKADGAKPKAEKPASKAKSKAKTEAAPTVAAASAVAGTPVSPRVSVDVAAIDRERILKAAEKALSQAPVSITAFPAKLSEGGVNDFYSNGDYWWPDPAKPNGLPYIRRDGQTNPENFSQHRLVVKTLRDSVASLAAAYKVTGDDKYAVKAAELLRVFFLDAKLRMNPNLDFAQAVPGVSPGRGIGIIDALHLIEVPAAVKALERSPAFPPALAKDLRGWFRELAEWMVASKNGKEEAAAKNNHAVAFYLQLSVYADFIGDQEKLAACRKQYKEVFVGKQMALDGGFPLELARTKPYGYSIFQLDNMVLLCQVLSTKEDNLWDFTLPDGRGIRKAVAFLYPFLADKSKWTLKPDVQAWEGWPARQPGLLFAGRQFGESAYLDLWKKLPSDPTDPEVQRNIGVTQPVLW